MDHLWYDLIGFFSSEESQTLITSMVLLFTMFLGYCAGKISG